MRAQLVDEGLLTPESLNLRDRGYDTKDVRASVEQLADSAEGYLETVKADGMEETVRQDSGPAENSRRSASGSTPSGPPRRWRPSRTPGCSSIGTRTRPRSYRA